MGRSTARLLRAAFRSLVARTPALAIGAPSTRSSRSCFRCAFLFSVRNFLRAVSQESVARVSDARRRGALRFTSRCFKGRSQKRRNRSYLALDPPAAEIVIAPARVRPRDKGLPMRLARSGVSAPGGGALHLRALGARPFVNRTRGGPAVASNILPADRFELQEARNEGFGFWPLRAIGVRCCSTSCRLRRPSQ